MQTSNATPTVQADPETSPGTQIITRTMLVKFMETDRADKTMTFVRRAVGVSGVARHFALTVKMKPSFWRKFLKTGPLPSGTMIDLTLEQGWNDDEVCTYATNFSVASEAAAPCDLAEAAAL